MTDPGTKPVIFLAFAQDREDKVGYLRNLPTELNGIRKALQKARQAGLCDVVERANTTVDNILDVFQEYRDRVAIFHYGGHAGSYELLLESASGEHQLAHSEGLISFLAKQKGLQMVFLNGCSSQQQAFDLLEAGVAAVVGTSQKINDDVATGLSLRFYKGLAQGATIDRAWAEAVDQVKVEKGTGNFRDLFGDESENEEAPDRFPWEIYYNQASIETVKSWNLAKAARNPLFFLPRLAGNIDLPPEPFLFLGRYEREHARIFFGRSYAICDLYNRGKEPKSDPLILLAGQSGVGKSSLFDAGLLPRLESEFLPVYLRRDETKGLAETLLAALEKLYKEKTGASVIPQLLGGSSRSGNTSEVGTLASSATSPPKTEALRASANSKLFTYLKSAMQEADDDVKQELEALLSRLSEPVAPAKGVAHQNGVLGKWKAIEQAVGKPLVVILDQAEELYTRPLEKAQNTGNIYAKSGSVGALPAELEAFLVLLDSIFSPQQERPRGKLILGYRKEYHLEIEEGFKLFRLPWTKVFLKRLDQRDIVDIFKGITETPGLQAKYKLSLAAGLDVEIADDLIVDNNSPVAPILQIIMKKMWVAATETDSDARLFTQQLYHEQGKNIAMRDFFREQMEKLARDLPKAVATGLALDVLYFHTTPDGMADSCSQVALQAEYEHCYDMVEKLVRKCKGLSLLSSTHGKRGRVSLSHDTLAPVVIREFNDSDLPSQRAMRILKSKAREFNPAEGVYRNEVWLNEVDLQTVDENRGMMRRLTKAEEELLAHSWKKLKYTEAGMKKMIRDNGYHDKFKNPDGAGIAHKFELQADDLVVYDGATGLYWQQAGSNYMIYPATQDYIAELNRDKYAGYSDWRLPTMEEAMSLMEGEQGDNALFIDPTFNTMQYWNWTADQPSVAAAWCVSYRDASCSPAHLDSNYYVRAVRRDQ